MDSPVEFLKDLLDSKLFGTDEQYTHLAHDVVNQLVKESIENLPIAGQTPSVVNKPPIQPVDILRDDKKSKQVKVNLTGQSAAQTIWDFIVRAFKHVDKINEGRKRGKKLGYNLDAIVNDNTKDDDIQTIKVLVEAEKDFDEITKQLLAPIMPALREFDKIISQSKSEPVKKDPSQYNAIELAIYNGLLNVGHNSESACRGIESLRQQSPDLLVDDNIQSRNEKIQAAWKWIIGTVKASNKHWFARFGIDETNLKYLLDDFKLINNAITEVSGNPTNTTKTVPSTEKVSEEINLPNLWAILEASTRGASDVIKNAKITETGISHVSPDAIVAGAEMKTFGGTLIAELVAFFKKQAAEPSAKKIIIDNGYNSQRNIQMFVTGAVLAKFLESLKKMNAPKLTLIASAIMNKAEAGLFDAFPRIVNSKEALVECFPCFKQFKYVLENAQPGLSLDPKFAKQVKDSLYQKITVAVKAAGDKGGPQNAQFAALVIQNIQNPAAINELFRQKLGLKTYRGRWNPVENTPASNFGTMMAANTILEQIRSYSKKADVAVNFLFNCIETWTQYGRVGRLPSGVSHYIEDYETTPSQNMAQSTGNANSGNQLTTNPPSQSAPQNPASGVTTTQWNPENKVTVTTPSPPSPPPSSAPLPNATKVPPSNEPSPLLMDWLTPSVVGLASVILAKLNSQALGGSDMSAYWGF